MNRSGLWANPDFLKLWAGETASIFGTLISRLAIPFVAILALGASAADMGYLRAAQLAPALLVGLFAGVWVDRLRRRPLMIGCDLGRAALLAAIGVAVTFGALTFGHLYVAVFLIGTLTVVYAVAFRSYVPSLVRRDELVEANSKLQATSSVAEVAGFGLAGALVQAFTAPIAVVIDATSYLISAACLAMIGRAEPKPERPTRAPSVMREIREGLRFVWRDPLLAPIAAVTFSLNLSFETVGAVFILFVTRELGVAPAIQGLVYAVGGISSLVGAMLAGRAVARLGLGRTLAAGLVFGGIGSLCVPLAMGPMFLVLTFLVAQQMVADGAITVYQINEVSLVQAITPDRLQGRMNATLRFVEGIAMLLGALLGGLLGETIGLRSTLVLGSVTMTLSACWVIGSALGRLRDLPPQRVTGVPA